MKHDPELESVKSICKALIAEREAQGMSQKRLSELAGISRTGLRHIESLETNPTLYSLMKIAEALRIKLGELAQLRD